MAHGGVVRLDESEAETETTFGTPVDVALGWQSDGAEWIHLVDIDAALDSPDWCSKFIAAHGQQLAVALDV